MANRSYLYSHHPDDEKSVRDLSEWRSNPPVSHLFLVGVNPEPVASAIWTVEEKIAIRGDAAPAKDLFFRFLDWFAPQVQGIDAEIAAAKTALNREDRQGKSYHLELGEVYDLSGYDLPEMAQQAITDAKSAGEIVNEVRELLETDGATIGDSKNYYLREAAKDWEQDLGLYFPGILYFHMG